MEISNKHICRARHDVVTTLESAQEDRETLLNFFFFLRAPPHVLVFWESLARPPVLSPLLFRRIQRPPCRRLTARPYTQMQLQPLLLLQQTPCSQPQAKIHCAHQQRTDRRHPLISSSHRLETRRKGRQHIPSQPQCEVPEHAHNHQARQRNEGPELWWLWWLLCRLCNNERVSVDTHACMQLVKWASASALAPSAGLSSRKKP